MAVFLDGDYSDRPSGLPMILAPIIQGSADITSLLSGKNNPGALPWHQSFGNRLAAGLSRPSYGAMTSVKRLDGKSASTRPMACASL